MLSIVNLFRHNQEYDSVMLFDNDVSSYVITLAILIGVSVLHDETKIELNAK